MSISPVSSSYSNIANTQAPIHSERAGERENDGDQDDGGSAAVTAAQPRPTVNTSGQVIGSILNVQA